MDPPHRFWVWVPLSIRRARKRLIRWYKREDVAGEIVRLRQLVDNLLQRFLVKLYTLFISPHSKYSLEQIVEVAQLRKHQAIEQGAISILLLETPRGQEALSRRKLIWCLTYSVS